MRDLVRRISELERRLDNLIQPETGVKVSTANVSGPPTDAELDAEFGTPATVGAGFMAIIDDNGDSADNFLVWSDGTHWWYVTGTQAT